MRLTRRSLSSVSPPTKIQKRVVEPDKDTLFLIPFGTTLSLEPVHQELAHTKPKRKLNCDGCFAELYDNATLVKYFPRAGPSSTLFLLQLGHFVFLQPQRNDARPAVAKITSIAYDPRTAFQTRIGIIWFYRGEDLGTEIPYAVGEDEVFETNHTDVIDADLIVGRCSVSSYPDWIKATEKTEAQLNSTPSAAPSKRVTRNSSRKLAASATNANASVIDVPLRASRIHNGSTVTPLSSRRNGHTGAVCDGDDEDDTDLGNYELSSLHLYCRRFYEPGTQRFVCSRFENETTNPLDELELLRRIDAHQMDADYVHPEDIPSDDEPFDQPLSDDEVKNLSNAKEESPLRKRQSTTLEGKRSARRRGRLSRATFALPAQLGTLQKLPCRDPQKERVRVFIRQAVQSGTNGIDASRCLYISGVPGTGKTATVREVVYDLQMEAARGDLARFKVVEVNAMTLSDPAAAYVELYASITGRRDVAPMHAAQLLEGRFCDVNVAVPTSGRKRAGAIHSTGITSVDTFVLLILDEMDVLLARKQKVLYDLLEWPTRPQACMAVIGIANTMDLPERMLPRLGSRLGLNRLVYPPYTREQIEMILNSTLDQSVYKFDEAALRLCSAKIGAVSGDVRRATELCRRATEIVAERVQATKGSEPSTFVVKAPDMQSAIQESLGNFRIVMLQQLSLFERLTLVAAIDVARRQGAYEIEITGSVEGVCERAVDLAKRKDDIMNKVDVPSHFDIEEACWRLAGMRMVIIEKAVVQRQSRVIVNVPIDDCKHALQHCELCKCILAEL